MKIRDFEKFLEEITIKGNPGIPGEDDEQLKKKSPYLSEIERQEKQKLGITGAQTVGSLGGQLMSLLKISDSYVIEKDNSGRVIADHRKELEELASEVMMVNYEWIINRYEIELDIKFIESSQISSFLQQNEREEEDEEFQEAEQQFSQEMVEVTDKNVRDEVHKRKIANLIIQGEAKHTKHILHSQEVKDGLNRIYGEEKAKIIFETWDKITKIADKLDWIIPTQSRSQMMMANPEGFAGACGYAWNKKEKDAQEKEEEEEDYFLPQEEEDEYTEWTGGDEEEMYSEDIFGGGDFTESKQEFTYTPILRARGVDFPMLLHESVKGLFELLSLGGIPDDPKTAEIVVSETGLADEPEDWKYGPRIANDFRKFVQVNRKWDNYPNIKEELFKYMFHRETMPTDDLLRTFRGILAYSMPKDHPEYEKLAKDVPFARKTVDACIDEVIERIESELDYQKDMEEYRKKLAEYEREKAEYEAWEAEQKRKAEQKKVQKQAQPQTQEEPDYSEMSKRDIQSLIDDALDKGDFATVKMLSNLPNYKR